MPLNAAELQVSLAEPGGEGHLRVRLANALRDAIRGGRLGPGTTLPSTRILAQDLGLSRGVVVGAYTSNDSSAASPRAWDCGIITRSSSPA